MVEPPLSKIPGSATGDVIFPLFRGNPLISSILEKVKPSGFDLK
jgi:hypothetical protein